MDTPPKFFIPLYSNRTSEELYQIIKARNTSPSYPITDRRIFKLVVEHKGPIKITPVEVQVGKQLGEHDEVVVAIFESQGWYLVCTLNQGAVAGSPKYIDAEYCNQVVEFGA